MAPFALRHAIPSRADRRGVAALEFALVAPMFLIFMFGVIELSRAIRASTMVSNAAATMAQLVGDVPSVSTANASLSDFCQGVRLLTKRFDSAGVATPPLSLAVANVTAKGTSNPSDTNFTPTLMWQSTTPCAGTIGTMTANPITVATPLLQKTGDSVVIVQANYAYRPMLSTFLSSRLGVTLSRTGNAAALFGTVNCTNC